MEWMPLAVGKACRRRGLDLKGVAPLDADTRASVRQRWPGIPELDPWRDYGETDYNVGEEVDHACVMGDRWHLVQSSCRDCAAILSGSKWLQRRK